MPKLERKIERDYKPQTSVGMVDTRKKQRFMTAGTKETSETRWNKAFLKGIYTNVHNLGNKQEEPECHVLLHNRSTIE